MRPKKTRKTDLVTLRSTPPWEWPSSAARFLAETLLDRLAKEADRLLAAELAGEVPSTTDELVDALLSVLQSGDEPEALRSRAAISLGPLLEYADEFSLEDIADILPVAETPPIDAETLRRIQALLHKLYLDASVPDLVRRKILEASVRAPQDWHRAAIRAAYSSGRRDWVLTSVFCMRFASRFGKQVLQALESDDPEIQFEAVRAGGIWGLDEAWPHVVSLVGSDETDKDLLLAAINAVACIRPGEAPAILIDLLDADDEDIVETVQEALAMIEDFPDADDAAGDDDPPWDCGAA
ncbi:MAG: hypothetical protein Q8P31_00030 [Bacillota bacterium]|nr:hypothetical protein [Bacillota bacterium]